MLPHAFCTYHLLYCISCCDSDAGHGSGLLFKFSATRLKQYSFRLCVNHYRFLHMHYQQYLFFFLFLGCDGLAKCISLQTIFLFSVKQRAKNVLLHSRLLLNRSLLKNLFFVKQMLSREQKIKGYLFLFFLVHRHS